MRLLPVVNIITKQPISQEIVKYPYGIGVIILE